MLHGLAAAPRNLSVLRGSVRCPFSSDSEFGSRTESSAVVHAIILYLLLRYVYLARREGALAYVDGKELVNQAISCECCEL
jgi:hypothetical protein